MDRDYFRQKLLPLLDSPVNYLGHPDAASLVTCIGSASAVLVTPQWDEPSGIAAIMAMACGTPVLGINRGALPELVPEHVGRLLDVEDDDAAAADALAEVFELDRAAVREHAERIANLDDMLDSVTEFYRAHSK